MPCDYTMPAEVSNVINIEKDMRTIPIGITKTAAPTGITFEATGDDTNIYTLLLAASSIPTPSVSMTTRTATAEDGIFVNGPPRREGGPRPIYWVQNGTNVAKWISSCNACAGLSPCGGNSRTLTSLASAGYVEGSTFNCQVDVLAPSITAEQISEKFRGTTSVPDSAIETLLSKYGFSPLANIQGTTSETIQTAITQFNVRVNFTYCAYEKMYKLALTNYFDSTTIENKKKAILLNLKLNIIINGLNRIRVYFQSKSAALMASTNANNDIASTTIDLQNQLSALTSKDSDRALYTRMVEYTEEKNQAHRNLLGLYSFLNLVALGIVFYIARE